MRHCAQRPLAGLLALAGCLLAPPRLVAAEVLAPPSWTGEWEITTTYRAKSTGRVVAVDRITDDICPNEPLGLALFPGGPGCQATITDADLGLRCGSRFDTPGCSVEAGLEVDLQHGGGVLSGTGEWSAAVAGGCGAGLRSAAQTIEVSAIRLSLLPRGCSEPSSVIQKFVRHPAALMLSAIPFSAFTLEQVDVAKARFEVAGTFVPARGSDGIDPRREPVRLLVGAFDTTIPAGSFRWKPAKGRKPGAYGFAGRIGGVRLDVTITPLADGGFAFRAGGERAPVGKKRDAHPFALAVGNDGGVLAASGRHAR